MGWMVEATPYTIPEGEKYMEGGLVMAKSGRLELEDNILRTL